MGSSKRLTANMDDSASEDSKVVTSSSKRHRKSKKHEYENGDEDADSDNDDLQLQRQLRANMEHKALKEILNEKDDELANPASKVFDEVLKTTNKTFKESVHDVRSAGTDAMILRTLAEKVSKQAANIGEANQRVNATLLSNKLIDWFGESGTREVDFARLGHEVKVFFRSIPSFDCMFGPLELRPAPKKEKVKRERKVTVEHPVERPREMTGGTTTTSSKGQNGADETQPNDQFQLHTRLQNELHRKVSKNRNINMFEAVVDPKSFTQTVENVFALTFLVKDGLAQVKVEDDQVPRLQSLNKNNPTEVKAPSNGDSQFIATFSYEDWQRIQEEFNIERGLLEHRVDTIYDDARVESEE